MLLEKFGGFGDEVKAAIQSQEIVREFEKEGIQSRREVKFWLSRRRLSRIGAAALLLHQTSRAFGWGVKRVKEVEVRKVRVDRVHKAKRAKRQQVEAVIF